MKSSRLWILVLSGALLAACSKGGKSPRPVTIGNVPAVQRQVSGVLLDAATGAPVTVATQVTVLGADGLPSPHAQDGAGQPMSAFVVNTGVVAFQVDKTAQLPIDLVVVTKAPGYDAGSARLQITGQGAVTFTTRLANLDAPPAGVFAAVEPAGAADETGKIAEPIQLATPTESSTVPSVQLEVPADTVITTATGEPLTGALQASASYYTPSADTALAAFPGGLDVAIPDTEGGATTGTFQSAGFTAVEITDASGNVAANFSNDFALTVKVPAGTLKPDGDPVAVGDLIPFWSYNEATGKWESEGDVQLTSEVDGLLIGVAHVNHMSYFNLDWFSESCPSSQPITITGNADDVALTLTLRSATGGYFKELHVTDSKTSPVTFANAPSFPIDVEASLNGNSVGAITGASLCGSSPLTLEVTLPSVSPASLEVAVVRVCTQDGAQRGAVGSATVFVQPAGLIGTTSSGGTTEFKGLLAGAAVSVSAQLLDGTTFPPQSVTLAAGANKVEFAQTVECPPLTGGAGN